MQLHLAAALVRLVAWHHAGTAGCCAGQAGGLASCRYNWLLCWSGWWPGIMQVQLKAGCRAGQAGGRIQLHLNGIAIPQI